ncbi:hypothetical protein BP6252_13885 [Coleophoma cylindrospora]|uniref:S-adenosyl-L-methionine-dependent methyltransferase n=1 Tax=Coleophoma cylindrospora TaxID=1849047 RepID=A0A3D8Q5X6_9HELO|nr:hypothetical protein BP6252_13885 [Coleophoma cylindrospora]
MISNQTSHAADFTASEPVEGLGSVDSNAAPLNQIITDPLPLPSNTVGPIMSTTVAAGDLQSQDNTLADHQFNAQSEDGHISVDINDDSDSAVGDVDSRPGSTMSIRSSIYDYVEENGRTYHRFKEGQYIMPNDEIEQNRLDMQHKLCLMTLNGKLHLAPIKKDPHHVLDIGTGTGIWAIDFATKYPSANVIGSDLSPIQPDFLPPNCTFEVEDVEDEWVYNQKFDYIHGRLMVTCFKGEEGTRGVFAQAYNALAPGGYFEMQDGEFPMTSDDGTLADTALWRWNLLMMEGGAKSGRPWTRTRMYKAWMIEAGFEDVKEELMIWPINTWPRDPHLKKIGLWFREDMLEALSSTKAMLTRVHGWTSDDADIFLSQVRQDYMNRGIHAYTFFHVVYGRKPE